MGSANCEVHFLRDTTKPSSFETTTSHIMRKQKQISRKILVFASVVALTGVVCLVTGIALLRIGQSKANSSIAAKPTKSIRTHDQKNEQSTNFTDVCGYSAEMKKSGLLHFIEKMKKHFYYLHPYEVPYKPRVSSEEVKRKFEAFDPHPARIKNITDVSLSLLRELNSISVRTELLKAREVKALAELKHFLAHSFGNVYDYDYYSGQWMLGPNRFCYMQMIAKLPFQFRAFLKKLSPSTVEDANTIIKVLKSFGKGITRFHKNVKLGVKSGMIGSKEECIVGLDCLKQFYPKIGQTLREEDILWEPAFRYPFLTSDFLGTLQNASELWLEMHGISLEISLVKSFISDVGNPLARLMRYLKVDHLKHCVPSNVSSGLFNRPLYYVYYDGVANLSEPTTRALPTGELIDAKAGYERTMRYFTTTNHTAASVHQLGWSLLRSLYPQAVEIAKSITGVDNETEAQQSMRAVLNSSLMYFNEVEFPENESDENAHRKCSNEKDARIFCPKRFAAMQKWFEYSRSLLSQLEPKLLRMFHWPLGPLKTTPVCPVAISVNFMPSTSAQSYTTSYRSCRQPALYRLPFFLDRMGPKYSEWTTSAHEARPGHHLQSQGHLENFLDRCGPVVSVLAKSRYTAYSEGWALYAECPLIANETDVYYENLLGRYGMLKWQIWRALRLIVDTGLHYLGMSRDAAIRLFNEYAWDDTDVARKEVTRYQSGPGQATTYTIGQRAFVDMRNEAQRRLGSKFDIRDFHFYVLSRGPSPLSYIKEQIENYIECTLNRTLSRCKNYLHSMNEWKTFQRGSEFISNYADELETDTLQGLFSPEIHEY